LFDELGDAKLPILDCARLWHPRPGGKYAIDQSRGGNLLDFGCTPRRLETAVWWSVSATFTATKATVELQEGMIDMMVLQLP
jgi:hypothetical protein